MTHSAELIAQQVGDQPIQAPHQYRDTAKMIDLSQANWGAAEESGLINLYLDSGPDGTLVDSRSGREPVNMSSYSYLGLNYHPAIINGVIDALVSSGHLIDGKPRVAIFDKRSHFRMDYMKPVCAGEAPVLIAPHNDIGFRQLLAEGFYVSPVYFPVTSRGREGLREMVTPHVID